MIKMLTTVAVKRPVVEVDRQIAREADAWTGRFSSHLQLVKPLVSILARHQKALAAFEVARDLDPEAAARIWADAPPPEVQRIALHPQNGPRAPSVTDPGMWLLQFVVRLRQLKPELSLDELERAAVETLEFAGPMDPNESAAIYASAAPPIGVGAPRD